MFENAGLGGAGFGEGGFGVASSSWLPPAPPVPRGQETGAGPDDELRLDLVDGPFVLEGAARGNARPWRRDTSTDERRRFNLAHARLDSTSRRYWYKETGIVANVEEDNLSPRSNELARQLALKEARDKDLRCINNDPCWQRFRQERLRLELGRLYHGVDLHLPFYLAASGVPSTYGANPNAWRILKPRGHYDGGHRQIDGQGNQASRSTLDTAAASVCGSRNESCQQQFSQERVRLEYIRRVRAQDRPQDFYGFYLDPNGNVSQAPKLLDDSPPAVEGRTIFIPGPQDTDLTEKPSDFAPPRFNPNLPRFDLSRLKPQTPATPYITDRLRPLASTDAATPDPAALPPEVQAELELLRAQLAAVGVETSSLRDLVELLRSQAVELEGEEPGLFAQLWAKVKTWWMDLFDGDDDDQGPPPSPAALLPENSGASLPPEMLSGEGAEGPELESGAGPDDAPQSFGSRLLSGAKDLALWGGIAVTVILLTGIITAGIASRWTAPAVVGLGGKVLDTVGGLGGKALDTTSQAASALVPVLSKVG